jgi:endonuclease YncB( thermonuclease family)
VVDGRTLRVRMKSGKRRTVRLLGIDISQARRCGGPSTRSRLRAFTPAGSQIAVKTDKRVAARDARGRMLAYVSRSRHDIGKALISRGWARVSGARNIGRLKAYKTAQRKASRQNLGLWRCG